LACVVAQSPAQGAPLTHLFFGQRTPCLTTANDLASIISNHHVTQRRLRSKMPNPPNQQSQHSYRQNNGKPNA
jgi:hypothetical protein